MHFEPHRHRVVGFILINQAQRHGGVWKGEYLSLCIINPLPRNDIYTRICRTAALTSRRCILNIYSTNIRTEYFKHAAQPQFFFSSKCRLFHNATLFGSCIFKF
jgi:hypothetical protein